MSLIEISDWGLIDYQQALTKQENLLEKIHQQSARGCLILCSHSPVVTLGRKTEPGDVFAWNGPIIEVSRGGRATYHGPSQLMVYPIINLNHSKNKFPKQDIGWFLRALESSIVNTLKKFGVDSTGKTFQKKSIEDSGTDETGVWVDAKKIASLGLAVRKWITFHGAAINLDHDPKAFQGLNPCGFKSDVMTNLEDLTGRPVNRQEFKAELISALKQQFLF